MNETPPIDIAESITNGCNNYMRLSGTRPSCLYLGETEYALFIEKGVTANSTDWIGLTVFKVACLNHIGFGTHVGINA